ncbi:17667_t:CDS:2, partial [Dentiscutata erythropus]
QTRKSETKPLTTPTMSNNNDTNGEGYFQKRKKNISNAHKDSCKAKKKQPKRNDANKRQITTANV